MKTIERLLLLIAFLAAIGACLNACGQAPGDACTVTIGGQNYGGEIASDGKTCALLCNGKSCFGSQP